MKASPIITSLNAGELSQDLDGRVDLTKYPSGCKVLENFIPKIQGPAMRRAGLRYVKETKDSADRSWLMKFEFSSTQAYVLEFGDGYVRFYADHGQVIVSGVAAYNGGTAYVVGDLVSSAGVNYYCIAATTGNAPPNATYWYAMTGTIYEIPSPYALADLTNGDGTCALKTVQSGDVIYIANQYGTYAPRKLIRYGATNWQFSTYAPNQGPFLEQNTGSVTIYASASTGSVDLTASSATFASTDVGRLVRLQVQNQAVQPWETAKAYVATDLARYDGKTYEAQNNATSGTSPPVHERGTAYDGKSAVNWEYQDAGYGIARITAFTSATVVTATVISDTPNGLQQLPAGVVGGGNASTRWSLGAWSATTEYPRTVTFFRNRLFWAGEQRLWGSVPNDFENMAGDFFGETRTDNAIWSQLQAEDVNAIQWIVGDERLAIGTGGGEFIAGEITTTDPLGPANFSIKRQSKKRVRSVQPIGVGNALLFVQRAGRKLLAMSYSFEVDKYSAQDLAVLSNRITRTGIVDIAYQGEPDSIAWCVLGNGNLVGFTYDRDQEVTGWHRHPIGGDGDIESVVVIPAPDGTREELWCIVKRTLNGATQRYVEYLEKPWESNDEDGTGGDDQEDAFYVDSGLTYDGAATTSLTGLDHLEGEEVDILADGAVQPSKTVSGGAITLDRAASVVHVGLRYTSRLVTMRLEAGANDGTSQGRVKRIYRAVIRFLDTLGGKVGMYGGRVDSISLRSPSTPMSTGQPFASGDVEIDIPGDYERDCRVEIRQEQPLPMTVAAIMPQLRSSDS